MAMQKEDTITEALRKELLDFKAALSEVRKKGLTQK